MYIDKRFIDPYEIQDKWMEFFEEDFYTTYVKCNLWYSDGINVESISCYKEVPHPTYLSSNILSKYWMFPGDKHPQDGNPPPIPSIDTVLTKNKIVLYLEDHYENNLMLLKGKLSHQIDELVNLKYYRKKTQQ